MEKVLIIGINSILGVEIAKQLMPTSNITGIYHSNTSNIDPYKQHITLINVTALETLKDEFSIVYFISAFVPQENSDENNENLFRVNVALLQRSMKQFLKASFLLSSSVSVYGKNTLHANEKTLGSEASPYGLSKLWAEEIVKTHPSYSILRISSMYGENMKQNTILPTLIKHAITKNKITLLGDGSRLQNYIHVKDVAALFIKAAALRRNDTYLATFTKSHTNSEVAQIIAGEFVNLAIEYAGEDSSQSAVYDSNISYTKLNYVPSIRLEKGIKELTKWLKKQF